MNTPLTQPQTIYPAVRYENANAAIGWLRSTLGFEEHEVCKEDGRIVHAELSVAGNLIMLGSGTGGGIYIALNTAADVDAAYARAKEAGASITRELSDTDYGSREFSVRDTEGNSWSFGTYRPQARS